jgi:hypothetical protein
MSSTSGSSTNNRACLYRKREDGVHYFVCQGSQEPALREMLTYLYFIHATDTDAPVSRFMVDSTFYRGVNFAAVFREVRHMDRHILERTRVRIALVLANTFLFGFLNMLMLPLMRRGDSFRIFTAAQYDEAEAWLAQSD